MHGNSVRSIPVDGSGEPRWLLSIPATQKALGGIGERTVYQLIYDGEIEATKVGARRMVITESVDAYVQRLRARATRGVQVAKSSKDGSA